MKDYLNKNHKPKYRPEIDSLRGIAVIAVIIYHAKINLYGYQLFPGGYLGVDIFFVISGYLITLIIFNELQLKDKFSFTNFYLRRSRRILPALFFLIFCCIPMSWFVLSPSNYIDLSRSIYFSLGFSSNFYFYFTGLEYGAIDGLLKPLLHTWSLGVEEQYYILFPVLFVLGFAFLKKRLNVLIFGILLLSLLFAEFFSDKNSNLNFYILPSRAWELLIGSLLVFLDNKKKFIISNFKSNMLSILGVSLIFFSFTYFYDAIPSPNIKSTLPIIGTLLILIFFKRETIMAKILSNRLLVNVGLISYSLYLWHYPIFAFARNLRITQGLTSHLLIALLIFSISTFSYLFIEKPFRNKKFISNKNFIKTILVFLFILIASSFIIIINKGFESRYPNYNKFSTDYHKYLTEVRVKKYEFGNPQFKNPNKKNILIIGNSHGRDIFNSLKINENLFDKFEFSILDLQVRCMENIFDKFEFCNGKKMSRLEKKIFFDSETIIISSAYKEEDLGKIEEIIKSLKKYKKKIILTTMSPGFDFENYSTIIDKFYYEYKRLPDPNEVIILEKKYYRSMKIYIRNINKKLEIISKNQNIKLLRKLILLCNEDTQRCEFLTKNKNKIIFDDSHYTIKGAEYIGKKIFYSGWLELN
jgi:peptidoglycan/LPS O-acetylase OafA/YrhL